MSGGATIDKWPEIGNIAFLVIHGAGEPCKPYEALSRFVSGLTSSFDQKCHMQHKLHRVDERVDSYIRLDSEPPSQARIDCYEFYWDRYMSRDIKAAEVNEYFYQATDGAKAFYEWIAKEKDPDIDPEWASELQKRTKDEYAKGVSLFNKDGEFKESGYIYLGNIKLVERLVGFFLARRAAWYSLPLKLLVKFLLAFFKNALFKEAHDFIIYLNPDERWKHYDIRDKLLSAMLKELKLLLKEDYQKVIIVAHSMGTIIAYDALNLINRDVAAAAQGDTPTKFAHAGKIGLVTFGSPLDKVGFFNYKHESGEESPKASIQRQIENQRDGLKNHLIDMLSSDENAVWDYTNIQGNDFSKKLKWLNFYNQKDIPGGHLDIYDVENEWLDIKDSSQSGHSFYWSCPQMYMKIAEVFFN